MKRLINKIGWVLRKVFIPDKKNVDAEIRRRTILSMSVFAVLLFSGYKAWTWLLDQPDDAGDAKKPLRKGLETNEKVFRTIFSDQHLVKTYAKADISGEQKVNGDVGLNGSFDYKNWTLNVIRKSGEALAIPIEEIIKLPKTEIIYDFKCVEGWSKISYWGGVRFSDFVTHFNLHEEIAMQYAGMHTPDKEYYVGIDMPSMMHPQTILAYEMNGKYLSLPHGYPLRLIIPVKYGIKNLKRISDLYFSDEKPPDYWAERGYDYYSGL
jgi:hypothetical protein